MTATSVLSFERFAAHLAEGLMLDPATFVPEARLAEDLGLDSLDMVENLTRIEELGVRIPDEEVQEVVTLGDLYDRYVEGAGAGTDAAPEPQAGSSSS